MSETPVVTLSVVIPVYNNAGALKELSARLVAACEAISPGFEIIFVNDGSRDDSLRVLRELASTDSRIKVIGLSRNFGQHPAISAGFEAASGTAIVLMDADLQDRPEDIPLLLEELRSSGSDVVYSIKNTDGGRWARRTTSALYHYVFSKVVGSDVPLNIGTFRAFNRRVLDALLRFGEVNVLYGPLMFYIGFKASFVKLPYVDRVHGKSSYTFAKRLKLATNSLISYTDIPHRLTIWAGAVLLVGTLLYSLAIIAQYFLVGRSLPTGTTVVILLICVLVGAVLFSLGIIGSYVFRIYQEVLKRPRYLVRETLNLRQHAQPPRSGT
jgi:glycosyltransferase involved in cell wall biosynthesis